MPTPATKRHQFLVTIQSEGDIPQTAAEVAISQSLHDCLPDYADPEWELVSVSSTNHNILNLDLTHMTTKTMTPEAAKALCLYWKGIDALSLQGHWSLDMCVYVLEKQLAFYGYDYENFMEYLKNNDI